MRKGQLTLFIILGVFIVIAIILIFIFKNKFVVKEVGTSLEKTQEELQIQQELQQIGEEVKSKIEECYTEKILPIALDVGIESLSYPDNGLNVCSLNKEMIVDKIEEGMKNEIEDVAMDCLYRYGVLGKAETCSEEQERRATVSCGEGKCKTTINMCVKIKHPQYPNRKIEMQTFSAEIESKDIDGIIEDILMVGNEFCKPEGEKGCLDKDCFVDPMCFEDNNILIDFGSGENGKQYLISHNFNYGTLYLNANGEVVDSEPQSTWLLYSCKGKIPEELE